MYLISPQSLYEKLKDKKNLTLLDVRNPNNYPNYNIYKSVKIPLDKLPTEVNHLSKDKEIVTICECGNKAKEATALLQELGFNAYALDGGIVKGWNSIYDIVKVTRDGSSNLVIFQFKRLGKGCLSYIIILPDKPSALIIDPTRHTKVYIDFLKNQALRPVFVIDTHIHSDHISGGFLLSKELSIPYLLPKKSEVLFPFLPLETEVPKLIGNTIALEIIETPGHTKESVSLLLDNEFILTGDTLFVDTIGKVDIDEDIDTNARLLFESIKKKLVVQSENVYILPAHAPQDLVPGPIRAASMRYIKLFNPIRKYRSIESFVNIQNEISKTKSSKHFTIKNINKSGKIENNEDLDGLEFSCNACVVN